tara:strand:+ start:3711 stop:4007 length:297 start_codon:yes stop_codon:yes gene_type:complete
MARYKMLNGERVQLTAEEEAARDAEEAAWEAGAYDRAMINLRNKRDRLLKETDYYALSDVTMSEAMTNYRKDLRDITNGLTTVEEVNAVVFPTKPSGE